MRKHLSSLSLLAAPLLLSTAAAAQGVPIFTGHDQVTGLNPLSTAIADVNNDGKPDLLIANKGYNTVSIRLGDGMGGFTGTTEVAVGQGPVSISTGDINKDGNIDLATANAGDNSASYALGDGLGGFVPSPKLTIPFSSNLTCVKLQDTNNDGYPELMLASGGNRIVYVRDSYGTGQYYSNNYLSWGTLGPLNHFAVADVTNDGLPDMISTGLGSFAVYRQNAGRAFSVGAAGLLSSVAIADVNHDGFLDLIGSNQAEKSVTVRFGYNAAGTTFYPVVDVAVSGSPTSVAVGDVNGDGHPDLLTANEDANSVSVRLGDGTGQFSDGGEVKTPGAYSISLADLNGDNRLDFVTSNRSTNSVCIRLNTVAPKKLALNYSTPFTFNQGLTQLSWKPGNATNYVAFAREVRPGSSPLAYPVDGVTYGKSSQELVATNQVAGSTSYYLGKGITSSAKDTLLYLRNLSIGHVYEVAVYEYTVDPVQGPLYRSSHPTLLTFTAARFAPSLQGALGAGNVPSLTWSTPAQYKSTSFQLQQSADGTTFTDLAAPVAGMDSTMRAVTTTAASLPPIKQPTFYRVLLTNADGSTLYSNVETLTPKPLPVQLTSFTGAVKTDGTALLSWATASELNSEYFEVERSEDGARFQSVSRVKAAGTSNQAHHYQTVDSRPLNGKAYYRLHQVDTDGSAQYSSILVLSPSAGAGIASISPNPASGLDNVTLRLGSGFASTAPVHLRVRAAASNQLLMDQKLTPINGELRWPVSSYPAGVYLIEAQNASGRWFTRLLIN